LALSEDWWPRNVANDEQACRRGTRALERQTASGSA
jgi:hypothetical protein